MVTSLIKREIAEQFNIYKDELGIEEKVPLKFRGLGNGGGYFWGQVKLENGTVKQWSSYPERTKFLLIHELVHAKYKETKNPFLSTLIITPSLVLLYLMRELRANTIAYQTLGCKDSILEDYFYNYYPTQSNGYFNLSGGYVSGKTNVTLIKANPIWNRNAIEEAIEFFTSEFSYLKRTSKRKIEQVKNCFIEQLY
ncbi:hypothetical protein [Lysinibacillus sphaericus]|uniref:Uncharacterized protein n=1 Tax=Lysinibacillus sphaericus (strain C3-41) TaxID=444177 RepID=B1I0F9_LYSSC|nr:hypothetical protein [Lysinibacillus sphaericus]MBE5085673.1 hypothetical protein [Bacillus thuringiensis]ACA42318.1 hypothetical protein Bsph_p088 [Lysinibacillus sphaericus C3-41]AMO35289.1 hypothetical protein AR327_22625 [Lysinibacillus sphaericus]AMO35459.1 hypothetical protein AR327_23495 [Lysinibacillus sphaericus]AMR93108.1 hypothetical protein A1T07_23160 [Lysinibacillus sphaericus]